MIKLDGARVAVVGMAKSGVAAQELLIEKGAKVVAIDHNPKPGMLPQEAASFTGVDLVVLSPGVPADLEVIESVRARGVPVIGDLELASVFFKGDVIGITGSNGKTTTTALTGHILHSCGIAAQVGGNIGTPPASMVSSSREGQWNVLELSSFQLETIDAFRAHVGAALNVTPDHLDRHHTFERYAQAKARLFENQRGDDFAILNADDTVSRGYAACTKGASVFFSSTRRVERGAWLENRSIVLESEPLMESTEVPLRGAHNLENVMAAALIAQIAGVPLPQIREAVISFPGVEHRLEFVRELSGVSWYNDSKATNVDATLKAVDAFPGSLWIILGGKDKGSDYTPLAAALKGKAHAALLIGAAAEKIERQIGGDVRTMRCGTIDAAVQQAYANARSGDTVLLAPACASFDQFENYEHRGREFKRLVNELGGSQWRG